MTYSLNSIANMRAEEYLKLVPDKSVHAIICDPPYPEIDRDYGRMTEKDWHRMMKIILVECRRILVDNGSMVFIIQPNWDTLGKMRFWVYRFYLWAGLKYNLLQDVIWFNSTPMPGDRGKLLRPAAKYCVWLGDPNCYRDTKDILWDYSEASKMSAMENRGIKYRPSGNRMNSDTMIDSMMTKGGSEPMNVWPISNSDSTNGGGAYGHGAATPNLLMERWIKYITLPEQTVCDPFMGSGTTALMCIKNGRNYIGCEKELKYWEMSHQRIRDFDPLQEKVYDNGDVQLNLFGGK